MSGRSNAEFRVGAQAVQLDGLDAQEQAGTANLTGSAPADIP